jgi:hypothetical protein
MRELRLALPLVLGLGVALNTVAAPPIPDVNIINTPLPVTVETTTPLEVTVQNQQTSVTVDNTADNPVPVELQNPRTSVTIDNSETNPVPVTGKIQTLSINSLKSSSQDAVSAAGTTTSIAPFNTESVRIHRVTLTGVADQDGAVCAGEIKVSLLSGGTGESNTISLARIVYLGGNASSVSNNYTTPIDIEIVPGDTVNFVLEATNSNGVGTCNNTSLILYERLL